jgi:raffinose/stachyose/melibiose transport system substrate-binding protein
VASVLAAAALLAAGCSSSGSSASGTSASSAGATGTIRLYMISTFQSALSPAIASFEKANPDIHVNVQYVPPGNAFEQTLATEIQGGNAPDVFYTNPGYASLGSASLLLLAKNGKVADLSSQPWASQIPQQARSLYFIGSKLYGLPLGGSTSGMVYNETEFAKLGLTPPSTWPELLQLCGKIRAAGKIPVALAGQVPAFLPVSIAASTVYASDPSWDAQLAAHKTSFASTPGWQLALQQISQMNKAGCFQAGAVGTPITQAFQMTASGQALMFQGPTGALGAIAPVAHGATFGAFPIPGNNPASTRVFVSFGDSLAVSAHSAHEAAAIKFIDFLAQPANATPVATAGGDISLPQITGGQLPSNLAPFSSFFKQNMTVAFPVWFGPSEQVALSSAVQVVLNGQGSTTSALSGVDNSMQS